MTTERVRVGVATGMKLVHRTIYMHLVFMFGVERTSDLVYGASCDQAKRIMVEFVFGSHGTCETLEIGHQLKCNHSLTEEEPTFLRLRTPGRDHILQIISRSSICKISTTI